MNKQYGFLSAFRSTRKASKMTADELRNLQTDRFNVLLEYARKHSPYYAKLYANLPENPNFKDLPPVSKRELMESFEDWVTDPAIKLDELRAFIKD